MSSSVFADCRDAYKEASRKRDIRNLIIAAAVIPVGAVLGATAGPVVLPAASIVFVANYMAILTVPVAVTGSKKLGLKLYKNNFDQLLTVFNNVQDNSESRFLRRLIKRSLKKAQLEATPELEEEIRTLIQIGFEEEIFCPVAAVLKNGEEKHAVFNRKAIIDYLVLNLSK